MPQMDQKPFQVEQVKYSLSMGGGKTWLQQEKLIRFDHIGVWGGLQRSSHMIESPHASDGICFWISEDMCTNIGPNKSSPIHANSENKGCDKKMPRSFALEEAWPSRANSDCWSSVLGKDSEEVICFYNTVYPIKHMKRLRIKRKDLMRW